ncbi:VTT domain-containing protein [Aquisalimonas sp.]|uniref:VTT domain-containing protein n=1 Tax=Aquisalimonas sp. TaxID=1872621 RepID=UPI0025BC1702|nr:VTT domain-containing protein [Aquisalimonas sp.]
MAASTRWFTKRSAALVALLLAGLALAVWQPVELPVLLAVGERLTDSPLALALVAVAMAVLFTFALPGSLGLWLIAPFHPPLVATIVLLSGSVAGALGAYALANWLGGDTSPESGGEKIKKLLAARGDIATQCALRVLPGFPHSVVNYAAGVLRLPLPGFTIAAVIGLTVKWTVYTAAVRSGLDALEAGEAVSARELLPLVVLALLLIVGAAVRRLLPGRGPGTPGESS